MSISRPNYANVSSKPSPSPSSSSDTENVEIESIENIISDEEDDISVSSKSSSTSSFPSTSSTTSFNPRRIKTKPFSDSLFLYSEKNGNLLHTKRVTGIKILRGDKPQMISCGMDKKLICLDIDSGAIKFTTLLDGVPLCMSVDDLGSYTVLGFLDGRVQFFSTKSGAKIMEFTAHKKKVITINVFYYFHC